MEQNPDIKIKDIPQREKQKHKEMDEDLLIDLEVPVWTECAF